ncbi:MAG: NAD-dependent epimerase/dehydratase family protein [Lachnospiraceae bacterium]|nr:NAD-dependent epimerase/dehydratase family protein [Lachnospiraceae bacterium]
MTLYEHPLYMEDIKYTAGLPLPWERLRGRSVVISGATGMIGSFFIDVIMYLNRETGLDCTVYALGRDKKRFGQRFLWPGQEGELRFIACDLQDPSAGIEIKRADLVLHLASNSHPLQYATDPIGTILTNTMGLYHMLELAVGCGCERFVFASSNEIYGENRGDTEKFDEGYCGYIDPNTLRAGYPESKRCGEALCQAYRMQKGLDVVIPRLTRTYGPTMLPGDTKAISQFIRRGAEGRDIVLKSAGTQYYSYQYMADTVSGLITVMFRGQSGEAYNVADGASDITLKELAEMIAGLSGSRVVFEEPDAVERAGYSAATKARLDGSKLQMLGWKSGYGLRKGLERTIGILKSVSDRF